MKINLTMVQRHVFELLCIQRKELIDLNAFYAKLGNHLREHS
jgi:hypothetical protein